MSMWTFTCRACGKTQRQSVDASTRRVKCAQCDERRAVPKEARGEPLEADVEAITAADVGILEIG